MYTLFFKIGILPEPLGKWYSKALVHDQIWQENLSLCILLVLVVKESGRRVRADDWL